MAVQYLTAQGGDGASFGTTTSDLISMYGVTPIVQRSGSTQAAVATTAVTAVTTTAPISSSAYGFGSTQAAAIITAVNAVITQSAANMVLVNELRAAQVALGAIKGSA